MNLGVSIGYGHVLVQIQKIWKELRQTGPFLLGMILQQTDLGRQMNNSISGEKRKV
jgi:hypothetical protein